MNETMTIILLFMGIGFVGLVASLGGNYSRDNPLEANSESQNESSLNLEEAPETDFGNPQSKVLSDQDQQLQNALRQPPSSLQNPDQSPSSTNPNNMRRTPPQQQVPPPPPQQTQRQPQVPPQPVDTTERVNGPTLEEGEEIGSYNVVLKTSKGDIQIKLKDNETPKTVKNFVDLSRKGFYDETIFHRVIEDFMIQGGDPEGNGTGGPGYTFEDESFTGDYVRGAVAMANSGPDTNGSQFFIMHKDKNLPRNYVIFGEVVEGMEVVDEIATAETTVTRTGEKSRPVDPVKINSVEVIEE